MSSLGKNVFIFILRRSSVLSTDAKSELNIIFSSVFFIVFSKIKYYSSWNNVFARLQMMDGENWNERVDTQSRQNVNNGKWLRGATIAKAQSGWCWARFLPSVIIYWNCRKTSQAINSNYRTSNSVWNRQCIQTGRLDMRFRNAQALFAKKCSKRKEVERLHLSAPDCFHQQTEFLFTVQYALSMRGCPLIGLVVECN